jgi:hypothetical protein
MLSIEIVQGQYDDGIFHIKLLSCMYRYNTAACSCHILTCEIPFVGRDFKPPGIPGLVIFFYSMGNGISVDKETILG